MYLNGIVIVKKELNEPGSLKLGTEIPGNRLGTQIYILGYPRLKRENLRKVWVLSERKLNFCVGGTPSRGYQRKKLKITTRTTTRTSTKK